MKSIVSQAEKRIKAILSNNDNNGYGWAKQREETRDGVAALHFHYDPNASENFKITNNIFCLSTGPIIHTGAKLKWLPKLSGNTYVQVEGRLLAAWPESDDKQPTRYLFLKIPHLIFLRKSLEIKRRFLCNRFQYRFLKILFK